MNDQAKKPPLGVKPRIIHNHHRMVEIMQAMLRFNTEDKAIPVEWIDELMDLENYQYSNAGLGVFLKETDITSEVNWETNVIKCINSAVNAIDGGNPPEAKRGLLAFKRELTRDMT